VAFANPQPVVNGQKPDENQMRRAKAKLNEPKFTENQGQWPASARYLAKSAGVDLWVTQKGLTFDYFKPALKGGDSGFEGHVVGLEFVGGTLPRVVADLPQPGRTDFLAGRQRSKAKARSFSEIWSKGIYPGVDLRTYFDKRAPRYDFIVRAGADPAAVRMKFRGIGDVKVNPKGELVLNTSIGERKQGDLAAYQVVDGARKPVDVAFKKHADGTVGFHLGRYDASRELVIDPLIYGTYYGGDNGMDEVRAVVSDIDGGVYLTGRTRASMFPSVFGPYGFNLKGGWDAFVTKLQGDAYNHDYAALFGGALDDEPHFISLDPFGNVWVAGKTNSSDFPGNTRPHVEFLSMTTSGVNVPNDGSFRLTYGTQRTRPIRWNAPPSDVAAALNELLGAGSASVTQTTAGNLATGATYRIALQPQFGLRLLVDSTNLSGGFLIKRRPIGQAQILSGNPQGGTYTITFRGQTTPALSFAASAAQVEDALEALSTIGTGNVRVRSIGGGFRPMLVTFATSLTGELPALTIDNANLTGGTIGVVRTTRWAIGHDGSFSKPISGNFFIDFQDFFSGGIPWNANPAQFAAGVNGHFTLAGNAVVDAEPNPNSTLPNNRMVITLVNALAGNRDPMTLFQNMGPRPVYATTKSPDIFAIRFAKDGNLLNPLPTVETTIGGDFDERLAGFAIVPKDNPEPTDPVQLAFVGNTSGAIDQIAGPVPNEDAAYIVRQTYVNGGFVTTSGSYMTDTAPITLGGAALDRSGALYIAGHVSGPGNADTSLDPGLFRTTAGSFEGSRLLRNTDLFIRKYNQNGGLIYSVLVGGNADEFVGGIDFDMQGVTRNVGTAIAVDSTGNAYITGTTDSFNYPRTRGVYGEVFSSSRVAVVTKLSPDGANLVYSTNLQTVGNLQTAGISVDQAGNAYVTGNLHPNVLFPETLGQQPGDPNQPSELIDLPTIPTTPDALDPTYETPTTPEIPSMEGFVLVLNATASDLIYGSYLGGLLDDQVFGPYVDTFGDMWVCGWTDNYRLYFRFSSTGVPTVYETVTRLPATLINELAFKANPDGFGPTGLGGVLYGALDLFYPFVDPVDNNVNFTPIPTISTTNQRDGFVIRQRIAFPSISALTLTPQTVPGGLNASSAGLVTLSAPAPIGGAIVRLQLDRPTAASFSPSASVPTLEVTVPGGATTVPFTVYTAPVSSNTPVQVRATYLGSFRITQLVVVPWLRQLTLSPTEVVGGNQVNGQITLEAPAPAGGVTIDLLTDSPSLVAFPNGRSVTVPQGQQSIVFPINTAGVATSRFPQITASLLGVARSQVLTLRPVKIASLQFDPQRIAGGETTRGTLRFDGRTGAATTVRLRLDSGTPGYRFRATSTSDQVPVLEINVPIDTESVSFFLDTAIEPVNTRRTAFASVLENGSPVGDEVSGNVFVDAVTLATLTLTPNVVSGGQTSIGRITLLNPAPDGGVRVRIKSDRPSAAPVPFTVTVPAGRTVAEFPIVASGTVGKDEVVTITAFRGSAALKSTLRILATDFTFAIDPATVIGGSENSTGTITLPSNAPAGGTTVRLSSSNTSLATVPSSVVVPEGQRTITFPITTRGTRESGFATISARVNTLTKTQVLTVNPIGIANFTITPNLLRPFRNARATVTLERPAPAGGITVTIVLQESLFALYPVSKTVVVPAGETSADFTLQAKRFSLPIATTVTVVSGASERSVQVTILR
jgi:hypothetical protein